MKSNTQLITEIKTDANFFGALLSKLFMGRVKDVMNAVQDSDPQLSKEIEQLHKNMAKIKSITKADKEIDDKLSKVLGIKLN